MTHAEKTYLPAAGRDWALPLYDPLVKALGADAAKKALLDQADLRDNHRVLDIGCGTGTLAITMKRRYPDMNVVGLDPDPKALARSRQKAKRAGVSVSFDQGFSDELPYADGSFDRVFSSFMFHHLQPDLRETTLREVRRVLKAGGSLHLLDFERPETAPRRALARRMYANHHLKDNSERQILALMRQAGFADARKVTTGGIFFGLLRTGYYRAPVPI